MPFKTRRQKISAQERNYVFSDGKVSYQVSGENPFEKSKTITPIVKSDAENFGETRILKSELSRIIAISFVIIVLQVGLRMAPISSYLPVLR